MEIADIPEKLKEPLIERFDGNEFLEFFVPIYKRHLDQECIEASIAFYESEAGQRYLNAAPSINLDVRKVVGSWVETYLDGVLTELGFENPESRVFDS